MQKTTPLMPKGIAIWLIKNTKLSFKQISDFCSLHPIEIQNLADNADINPVNPILTTFELSREEIQSCEIDHSKTLTMKNYSSPCTSKKKLPKIKKYVPILHRQNKPNAILWLVKHSAQIKDLDIKKLIGTTKETIQKIRNKTYIKRRGRPGRRGHQVQTNSQ